MMNLVKILSAAPALMATILLPLSAQSFTPLATTMRPSHIIFSAETRQGKTALPSQTRRPFLVAAARRGKDDDDDDDRQHRDALALNRAKTDIRNFLTQRAIQSFMFLLTSCRDQPTVHWLEQKYNVRNLDTFHGTGAFNLTKYPEWDDILKDLLFTPPDVIVVSTKAKRRGSKNNPYLEDRYIDFDIDIDPPALVTRIISVRDQIAKEWTADLDTLVAANEMILDSYYATQEEYRVDEAELALEKKQQKEDDEAAAVGNTKNATAEEEIKIKMEDEEEEEEDDDDELDEDHEIEEEEDDDDDDDDDYLDEELASLTAPYSDTSYEEKVKAQKKKAYDRTAMIVLGNNIVQDGREPSPYRKGSFDLLGLLATQESVHRVLREYKEAGEEREVSFEWLRKFYVSRVGEYFDGSQEYGRADDFLEELLLTAPAMKEMEGKLEFIDPMRIAEDIIATRSEVAKDWKDIVEKVPTVDHAELRTIALQLRMGAMFEKSVPVTDEKKETERIVEEGFQ